MVRLIREAGRIPVEREHHLRGFDERRRAVPEAALKFRISSEQRDPS